MADAVHLEEPKVALTVFGSTQFAWLWLIARLWVGVALILGAFLGIAAFFGAVLNFSFVFAGSAGVNPAMILLSVFIILAWRNAGWIGLDRYLLPKLGVPWQHRMASMAGEPENAGV